MFKVKTNGSTVIKVNQSQEGTDRPGRADGGEEVEEGQMAEKRWRRAKALDVLM